MRPRRPSRMLTRLHATQGFGMHHALNPNPYRGIFGNDGPAYAKGEEPPAREGTGKGLTRALPWSAERKYCRETEPGDARHARSALPPRNALLQMWPTSSSVPRPAVWPASFPRPSRAWVAPCPWPTATSPKSTRCAERGATWRLGQCRVEARGRALQGQRDGSDASSESRGRVDCRACMHATCQGM